MEVPSPFDGVVKEILLEIGDVVNTGDKIAVIEAESDPEAETESESIESTEETAETSLVDGSKSTTEEVAGRCIASYSSRSSPSTGIWRKRLSTLDRRCESSPESWELI